MTKVKKQKKSEELWNELPLFWKNRINKVLKGFSFKEAELYMFNCGINWVLEDGIKTPDEDDLRAKAGILLIHCVYQYIQKKIGLVVVSSGKLEAVCNKYSLLLKLVGKMGKHKVVILHSLVELSKK